MPDPTETASGNATGGEAGQGTGLTLAQLAAQVAAISAAVSTMNDSLKSLTENVSKVQQATTTDTDREASSTASLDPEDSHRNNMSIREMALADCVIFRKACDTLILRKISQDSDHHDLGRFMPRSNSGPGANDAPKA